MNDTDERATERRPRNDGRGTTRAREAAKRGRGRTRLLAELAREALLLGEQPRVLAHVRVHLALQRVDLRAQPLLELGAPCT